MLAGARAGVRHGGVSPAGNPVFASHHHHSNSSFSSFSATSESANCQPSYSQKEKEGDVVFLSSTFSSISTLSKIMPGSRQRKQSLIAVKKIRPLR